jgi:hypothetical protein
MADIEHFDPVKIKDAILECGTLMGASKAIGCHHTTVSEYVKKYPELLKPAVAQGRINLVAKAERNLAQKIDEGDENSSKWWLANSPEGKAAGFGSRSEVASVVQFDPSELVPRRPTTWEEARAIYTDIENVQLTEDGTPEETPTKAITTGVIGDIKEIE